MKTVFKTLGKYQLSLIGSRSIGFIRDILVVTLFGIGVFVDDLTFIFSFADVLMAVLVGGGVAVFLADRFANCQRGKELNSLMLHAVLTYTVLAVVFVLIESFSDYAIALTLYDSFSVEGLSDSYKYILFSVFFSFPVAVFNGYFLFERKLYLQPLNNMVFSVIVVAGIVFFYSIQVKDFKYFALLVLVASLVRLCFCLYHYFEFEPVSSIEWSINLSFVKSLLLSGLGVGVLVIVPYYFRGGLSNIAEGYYAVSSLCFKVNDLVMAFYVLPYALIKINAHNEISTKVVLSLLIRTLFPVLFIVALIISVTHIGLFESFFGVEYNDLIAFVIATLFFYAAAYVVTLLAIKLSMHKFSLLIGTAMLCALSFSKEYTESLELYFYNLYFSLFVYCSAMLLSMYRIINK